MLNCKDKCEGWKNNYLHGIQDNGINKEHLWKHCPYCGAKLVDKEAELKEELAEFISRYNDNPAWWKSRDIANALISKYKITRKGN